MWKVFFALLVMLFSSCNKQQNNIISQQNNQSTNEDNMKDKSFSELFKNVDPLEFTGNAFKLIWQDYIVLTAGNESDYNSMTAGWGGWGIYFQEPATWCMLRANRYTLEYMRKDSIYTMCFFDSTYQDQVQFFGSVSGRNSDKMSKHTLTSVASPNASIAYKEAKIIIECKLSQITTVNPDDFGDLEMKKFIIDAHKEANDYHKLVFGKILAIWEKQ